MSDIPEERVRDVYLSLHHTHVPQLAGPGLARYDQEEDLVVRAEGATALLERPRDGVERLASAE